MPCFITPQKLDRDKSHFITNSEGDTGYTKTILARFTRVTLTFYTNVTQMTLTFLVQKSLIFVVKLRTTNLPEVTQKFSSSNWLSGISSIKRAFHVVLLLLTLFYFYWRIPENVFRKWVVTQRIHQNFSRLFFSRKYFFLSGINLLWSVFVIIRNFWTLIFLINPRFPAP